MEDDLKKIMQPKQFKEKNDIFKNGRPPQVFLKGRRPQFFFK
jgi:hypothetical protein